MLITIIFFKKIKLECIFTTVSEAGVSKKSSTIKTINKENTSLMTANAIFKPPVSTITITIHMYILLYTCAFVPDKGINISFE